MTMTGAPASGGEAVLGGRTERGAGLGRGAEEGPEVCVARVHVARAAIRIAMRVGRMNERGNIDVVKAAGAGYVASRRLNCDGRRL